MSNRPLIEAHPVIVDGDMSLASITSQATIIRNLTLTGYSYSWVGAAPIGLISVEVSNDFELASDGQTVAVPGTWTPIPLSFGGSTVNAVPLAGNTGNGFIDIDGISSYAIRTVYTMTSGTGLLQAIVNCKVA